MMNVLDVSLATVALGALVLIGGCSAAKSERVSLGATSGGYVCTLTGETLPCPKCCPLNKSRN